MQLKMMKFVINKIKVPINDSQFYEHDFQPPAGLY